MFYQGTRYLLCSSGSLPTPDQPCEPGVVATDAEDGDISHNVGCTTIALFVMTPPYSQVVS